MLFARRYEIHPVDGFLGRGGNGRVYRAWDKNQRQVVALKVLGRGLPRSYAFREAAELTRLGGDFILSVFNADVYHDVPYIAAELAPGGSAADVLDNEPKGLGTDLAITWTRHLLAGLGVCHAARPALIHRDVKPSNVFIRTADHAQLGDFGLVETPDAHGHVPGIGTPLYLPPEAHTAGHMTMRSDVYGAGLTLWELLTGASPFAGVPPHNLPAAIVAGVRVRLYDLAPHVPPGLARIAEKAISVQPLDRYATAEEMDVALGHLKLPPRVWQEVESGNPAMREWLSSGGRASFKVTAEETGRQVTVETRHAGGAMQKVRSGCFTVEKRRLPIELRTLFASL